MPKWLSEEALKIVEKRKDVKGKGEKERYTHLNAEYQRILGRKGLEVLDLNCSISQVFFNW